MPLTHALLLVVLPLPALAGTPLPSGWSVGAGGEGVVASGLEQGCAGLAGVALEAAPGPHRATVVLVLPALAFRGRRLRLSGRLSALGVTGRSGLWMRVDGGTPGSVQGFDDMRERPLAGSSSCVLASVVLDIPADAVTLGIGAVLDGTGRVELSAVRLSPVSKAVPATDLLGRGLQLRADPWPPAAPPAAPPPDPPGSNRPPSELARRLTATAEAARRSPPSRASLSRG
jgi:hypothetical protein